MLIHLTRNSRALQFATFLFFVCSAPLFAQLKEDVSPLVNTPIQTTVAQKVSAQGDTIDLPISDDFSRKSALPNPAYWADNFVYVNSSIPTQLYSIGAATFDGTDQYGYAYNLKYNGSDSLADVLTSRYIRFASAPNNLFLSFYYQQGGLGELPEPEDSLVVEFWSPSDSAWERVWSKSGNSASTKFIAATVAVTQPKHLQNGFRFRFGTYGALNGSFDVWNIDYVELDVNRNAADTLINEPAFVKDHPALTKNFTHIPWFHYNDADLKDSLTFTYRRNGPPPSGGWALNLGKYIFQEDGTTIKSRLTVPVVTNLIHNVDVNFKVPLQPVTTAHTDEFELFMRTYFDGTAEGLRGNDTVEITVPFKNDYAFDDGSAERGYGILNQVNARLAFQFQPITPDTLKGLFINFAQAGTDATLNSFRIAVWADNAGEPGLPIYISDSLYKPVYPFYHNGFIPFELDTTVFIPGSVFIGMIQTKIDAIHIGFDLNTTNAMNKYYGAGFVWLESLVPGTLMIRPYFKYTPRDFGFAEREIDHVKVYPNPAQNILMIETENGEELNWVLLNSLGQVVSQGNTSEINVANFARGMYILQTVSSHKVESHKIILQ